MSTDRPPRSNNPAAFNRSLKDRIRNETAPRGRSTEQLRREFFLQRFLARVFSQPGERWLLKGGASLLVRRTDARYSQQQGETEPNHDEIHKGIHCILQTRSRRPTHNERHRRAAKKLMLQPARAKACYAHHTATYQSSTGHSYFNTKRPWHLSESIPAIP
jgi:hypothetical protein